MKAIRFFLTTLFRSLRLCFLPSLLFILWLVPLLPVQAATQSVNPSEIHWTYQSSDGPNHWAELDSSFTTCATGQAQSPINFTKAKGENLPNLSFHYDFVPLNLLNNGHTIQLPYAPGSYMTLDDKIYNLLQLHFHSPSEHTIDSKQSAAELHLVHQSDDGELSIVAVLLQPSTNPTNVTYPLATDLPQKAGDKVRTNKTINALTLLPEETTTYRYIGSLTTPPCTESVKWLVMTEPVTISTRELSYYKKLLNNNNRPLQRLNGRAIQLDISSD
ncbi:MAG: carbonic anhydrase family protein [Cyanobacteria bacterium P01_D01_bin.1]